MRFLPLEIFFLSYFISICLAELEYTNKTGIWKNGAIRYTIRNEDYDLHSRKIIVSTFRKIEQETCLRFYLTELRPDSVSNDKHLYIQNEDKRKECQRGKFDYNNKVIKMRIGYNCMSEHEITEILMDMLKAGVTAQSDILSKTLSSYQPSKKTSDQNHLLTFEHHTFMNKYYKEECEKFKNFTSRRQIDEYDFETKIQYTEKNAQYYNNKIWPFGIVMYGINESVEGLSSDLVISLKNSMSIIEKQSCIVFEDISQLERHELQPKNVIWFNDEGAGIPDLGFHTGKKVYGMNVFAVPITPAHSAHMLLSLMRILGLPLESNRYDRDNYVTVNTKNIIEGYETFFDKEVQDSYLNTPYDFDSVTHPPVNWLCKDLCNQGQQTIQLLDDFQWKTTLSMGHKEALSKIDAFKLNLLYKIECNKREYGE